MNWADWTIFGILAVSSLIGLKRGFVKEALSLACWAAAFVIAMTFHLRLSVLLEETITLPSVRQMVAFGALFAATLIVGAMVNYLVGELVKMTGLTGTDRLFGMVFGLARGGVLVLVMVLLLPSMVPVDQDPWWQQSTVIPHFVSMEGWARQMGSLISDKVVSLF